MPDFTDRDKRRAVFCNTAQALANWEADRKKQIDCGIIPDPVQVFYTPEEPITGDGLDPKLPDQIAISNREVIVLCDFDTSGGAFVPGFIINPGSGSTGSYLINAGDYQLNISYTEIPGITAEQLDHIAKLNQEDLNEQFSNLDFSSMDLLKLKVTQESFLRSEIEQAFAEVNQIAYGAAASMVVCIFPSDSIIQCCNEGATSNSTGIRERCIVLPAGFSTSTRSKQSANQKANRVSDGFLAGCEYGNDPQIDFCPKPPSNSYASNEFGSVTISSDTFFGKSKEEANALALAAAQESLSCFYINTAVAVTCPEGEVIVVASGEIESNSIAEVDELVQLYKELASPCQFCSEQITCSCKNKFPNHPSDDEKPYESCAAVGSSQEEANERAREACIASLDCASGFSGWAIGGSTECTKGECMTLAEAIEEFGVNGFKKYEQCKAEFGNEYDGKMAENRYCVEKAPNPVTPPFIPSFSFGVSGPWELNISNGYVIERKLDAVTGADVVKFHEVGGVDYDNIGITHPIDQGISAYLEYNTNIQGEIEEGSPNITFANEPPAGTQRYYPEVGEYLGQSGKYAIHLFDLASDALDQKPYAIPFAAGDHVDHYAERGTLKNLSDTTEGLNYNVLKDYLPGEDTVQFRSIKQLSGDGVEIIDDSQSIDSISFRKVKGLDSADGQISVSEDNNAILVRGNGNNGTLSVEACDGSGYTTLLEWKDGLIVSSSVSFKAGCLDCNCCSDCPSDTPTDTPTGTPTDTPTDTPP